MAVGGCVAVAVWVTVAVGVAVAVAVAVAVGVAPEAGWKGITANTAGSVGNPEMLIVPVAPDDSPVS